MTAEKVQEAWRKSLKEAEVVLNQFLNDSENIKKCEQFSKILVESFKNEGKLLTCGNGGSHCDAMHFAEEFTGKYRKDRKPLGAIALGEASHTTCVGNDYGFEHIFSRQVMALGKKGDVLVGLSTSGNSKNVIMAVLEAKKKGMKTVALLGRDGGELKSLADLAIIIPAETSDRIQEMHIKLIHTVIETVERELFPQNY